jgi:hypothetical protein
VSIEQHSSFGRFFQQVAPGGPESLAIQDFAKQVASSRLHRFTPLAPLTFVFDHLPDRNV